MSKKIQKLSKRTERVIIDARQLKKCGTCFEFVVSMLRVVEMVCCVSPRVWTEGSENMLERLCQVCTVHYWVETHLSLEFWMREERLSVKQHCMKEVTMIVT